MKWPERCGNSLKREKVTVPSSGHHYDRMEGGRKMDKAERDMWDKAERLGYLAELRRRMMLFCIPLCGETSTENIFSTTVQPAP